MEQNEVLEQNQPNAQTAVLDGLDVTEIHPELLTAEHYEAEIDPDDIDMHPDQERIYGQTIIEEQFVQEIARFGQQAPALLREMPDGRYESISGWRRRCVAAMLGRTVRAVVYRKLSDDLVDDLLLALNVHRPKTYRIIANEIDARSRTLKRLALARQTAGVTTSVGILTDGGEAGRTDEKVAKSLGMKRGLLLAIREVYSPDYRTAFLEKLIDWGICGPDLGGVENRWDEIASVCDADETQIYSCQKEIAALRDMAQSLAPNAPKKAPPPPKKGRPASQGPTVGRHDPAGFSPLGVLGLKRGGAEIAVGLRQVGQVQHPVLVRNGHEIVVPWEHILNAHGKPLLKVSREN